MQPLTFWISDPQKLMSMVKDGSWIITDKLTIWPPDSEEDLEKQGEQVIKRFDVGTSDGVIMKYRQFFADWHPDKDFNKEFNLESCFIEQYQKKFGDEHVKWLQEIIRKDLFRSLMREGYSVSFPEE